MHDFVTISTKTFQHFKDIEMFNSFCRFVTFHLILEAVPMIVEGSEVDQDHLAIYVPVLRPWLGPFEEFQGKGSYYIGRFESHRIFRSDL